MNRTPTLAEVIRRALDARLADVRVALPARVEKYDAAKQVVDVLPLLQERAVGEDGAELVESLPVVPNVPVVFPGAGGFRVTFPVQPGDTVLLVFSDRSLDVWQAKGGEVDPVDLRRHHLADAVAIPGLRDLAHPLASAPTDRLSLGKDGGRTVEITNSDVILDGGTKSVARAGDPCTFALTAGPYTVVGTIQIDPATGAPHVKG